MRFSYAEWNLVPGNDDVRWFEYVDPPPGGGPRRIWPRFQCATVNRILTYKTRNLPNFYPLHICEMSLGGVHTSKSIGGTLRPWTVTFLAYAGTQFAYPRRDGQAKLPVLSRVDETRRTVAFWAPITIRSTYWTTYSKSLSRFCQSCVVADVLCNNSFLISVCFTSAI